MILLFPVRKFQAETKRALGVEDVPPPYRCAVELMPAIVAPEQVTAKQEVNAPLRFCRDRRNSGEPQPGQVNALAFITGEAA